MEENFLSFLKDGNNISIFEYGHNSKMMILKVPYNDKIDILYCMDKYNGDFFDLSSSFKYAGIYDKDEQKLFDVDYSIRYHILKWDYNNKNYIDDSQLYSMINQDINSKIYDLLQNSKEEIFNNENIEIEELNDEDVKKEFMEGETSTTLKDYFREFSTSNPRDILDYLTNKDVFIEEKSREYIIDNRENILYWMATSETKRKILKEIEGNENHPYHKIKNIIDVIKDSPCKTVNLTINKDGIEQTFVYDAKSLLNYHGSYLSTYNIIKLSDREKFEENYGRSADIYYSDIKKITYAKKTLYEDNDYLMENKNSITNEDELCL